MPYSNNYSNIQKVITSDNNNTKQLNQSDIKLSNTDSTEEQIILNKLEEYNFNTYRIGFNTLNQPRRNPNLQLRSEPPNPQVLVTPFYQTTIEPDMNRRAFDL